MIEPPHKKERYVAFRLVLAIAIILMYASVIIVSNI